MFQNDVNDKELTALKAVIKCIEDHKLEEEYPLDPLQKRVLQLEKAKADKKRATEVAKPQSKRPRANGVGYGPGPRGVTAAATNNVATDKNFYARMTDRYPQYIYDRPYCYSGPNDSHVSPIMGAAAAYSLPASHGNFFGTGYQYQAAPYLH